MDSFFTNIAEVAGSNHVYEPGVEVERKYPEKAENRYKNQEIKNKHFFEKASKIDNTLHIRYEDITDNNDIREIPEKYSNQICDFLGVERRILITELHKPKVINA